MIGNAPGPGGPADLLVFSHLRWDFVFQRPQHLISRFARSRRVFFLEEPLYRSDIDSLQLQCVQDGRHQVAVLTPLIPERMAWNDNEAALRAMLDAYAAEVRLENPILWFYTPAMLPLARGIQARAIVYDCMDELANFRSASPELPLLERALMQVADVVFTGGYSLYDAKCKLHGNVHAFPSGVDVKHFARAHGPAVAKAADQEQLPHPGLGFYGVIDERIDFPLLAALADSHPEWSVVMVGPIAKIGVDELVRRPNIHYLGPKSYRELPSYVAGWEVGLMPFAMNDATHFISPTKTPEYLAGGIPVVSTPITDVIRQYGAIEGVFIGKTPAEYISACEKALKLKQGGRAWLNAVDTMLADLSWDRIFERMEGLVEDSASTRASSSTAIAAA